MFGKTPQIDLTRIRPTSKLSLKLSCLAACGNEVDRAERLYDFIARDMEHLPEVDMQRPTAFQQFKEGAGELFGWIGSHRDELIEGWNFIQAMRGGGAINIPTVPPPVDLPPIPKP